MNVRDLIAELQRCGPLEEIRVVVPWQDDDDGDDYPSRVPSKIARIERVDALAGTVVRSVEIVIGVPYRKRQWW